MMKRKTLLIVALCLLALLPAQAQKGLQIDSLFREMSGGQEVAESIVTGSELKPYRLKYFRSISFKANAKMIARIARLIEADAVNGAEDTKIDYVGGQLNYAILRLPVKGTRENMYVCFQAKKITNEVMTFGGLPGDPPREVTGYVLDEKAKGPFKKAYVTVVYLKGKATMDDLNYMFKKR